MWLLVLLGVLAGVAGAGRALHARGGCGDVSEQVAPSCGAWWGVYTLRGADPAQAVRDLEGKVGRRFDITLRYHDFSRTASGTFPDEYERDLGRDRLQFVAWESRLYREDRDLAWADVAAGEYDADVVRPAARRIREAGMPLMLSFDPEMDRLLEKKGTAADYVAAARHVHDVFREEGVVTVTWAWVTTGYLGEGNADTLKAVYPGDAYVDWVGYDPYNYFRCNGSPWKSFEETVSPTYDWLKDNGFGGKPFVLAEYGTQFDPADPERARRWYEDVPQVLGEHPDIKALVRWDSSFDCGLEIDNGPGMVEAFAEAGRDAAFAQPGLRAFLHDPAMR